MFQQLKEKYLRRKARLKLIKQYEYVDQVNILMEEYMTGQLLRGGSEEFIAKGRANLSKVQQELKTNQEFVQFLKNTK